MKVVYIIQAVLMVFTVGLLAFGVIFAKKMKEVAASQGGSAERFYEELETVTSKEDLLASQMMDHARELIQEGQYAKADERMRFLINFYPDASFANEARRILSTMNLDQLMSPANPKYKTNYTIKSGDSLSRIADKHDSTVENIMELNGLLYNNRIHPGQEIIVMSLNFRTVIDLSEKSITLFDGETFVSQYPIRSVVYNGKSEMISTVIDQTMAMDNQRLISRISSRYPRSKKVNILKAGGLQIRPVKHPDEPDPGRGFFLSNMDMEEYNLLVRKGNVVEIRQ